MATIDASDQPAMIFWTLQSNKPRHGKAGGIDGSAKSHTYRNFVSLLDLQAAP